MAADYSQEGRKEERRQLRNHATVAECLLWKVLKGRQVEGFKFRRQHGVGAYVLDFYCPQLRLAIELDGEAHDTPYALAYDRARTAYLNGRGITVMRFRNEVVRMNIQYVVDQIIAYRQNRLCPSLTNHPCPSFGKGGDAVASFSVQTASLCLSLSK